jgi:hypothetical protein
MPGDHRHVVNVFEDEDVFAFSVAEFFASGLRVVCIFASQQILANVVSMPGDCGYDIVKRAYVDSKDGQARAGVAPFTNPLSASSGLGVPVISTKRLISI